MERGTKGHGKGQVTENAPTAYIGTIFASPNTTANYARTSNSQGYRKVDKVNTRDEQSGSYQRYTTKEEVSTGEMYRGRGHREYGVKDEYKSSSTLKVGDKSGYTEYYTEERVRNVSYGGGIYNSGGGGSKSIEHESGNNYRYGGGGGNNYSYGGGGNNYGYDYDSGSDDDDGDGDGNINIGIQSDGNDDGDGTGAASYDGDELCNDGHSDGCKAYIDASDGCDDDVQSYGCDSDSDY